ncbi:MAG TPA: polysaccharide pyruvyl transferase family protein [Syntrophales bacterium]|nr:polysaccharide pyruvyl transferase family protein [Syntrophales bacterium]HPC33609.1 polysaccharide pyruvyl transferase family protein [Syntrophales bacterium]HQG35523.1 polysaccharide pyruvyl transferase family protein [Syntrophales bacterium]HRR48200.1 polysaccharide pyruvyl transferase family protein [Syntrophales bacterium]
MPVKRLYIIGYYNYRNTGDDAIKIGLLHGINLRGEGNHTFDLHAKGESWRTILRKICCADLVILGGGTHMRDWGRGRWKQCLRIVALGILVRSLGKRFHMINIGIDGAKWEYISRRVANVVTVRDRDTFDSSVLIPYQARPREKALGVNLTPVHRLYFGRPDRDRMVLQNVVKALLEWKTRHREWSIRFYSFNGDPVLGDDEMNAQAAALVPDAEFFPWQPDVVTTIEAVSSCSAFTGMRYHSCVFAYITGTPSLIIETYPSCTGLAGFVGLPLVGMNEVLDGSFKLSFGKAATLPVQEAKKLALEGIVL